MSPFVTLFKFAYLLGENSRLLYARLFNRDMEFEPHFPNCTPLLTGDRACCVMNTLTAEMEIGGALDNEALL